MVRKRTDKLAAFGYSVLLDKNILSAKGESLMALAHRPSFSTGWQLLYECAILELDGSLLPDRIDVARRAMLDRVEEVLKEPSGEEHRALSNALHTLQILEEVAEREKIRYEEN